MAYVPASEKFQPIELEDVSIQLVDPITVPKDGVAEIADGLMQSQGFRAGVDGWRLDGDGRLWAQDITIGGRIISLSAGQSLTDAINTLNAGGGGQINLKAGTYVVTSAIQLKNSIKISGEDASNTIITFGGTAANIFCTGASVYTTGTITAMSGVNVTGSGTSWLANVVAGQHLFVGTRWYKIAAVTSNTTLILSEGYGDSVTFPSTYRTATIVRGVTIENLTLTGSTGTALAIQDCRQSQIDNVTFYGNNKGMTLTNVSEFSATQMLPVSNTSNGVELTNCGLFDWGSLNLISNGGFGGLMNNCKDILIFPCIAAGNTSDGINLTSCTNIVLLVDSSGNGGQGIEFVSGNDEINLLNPRIIGNASDGIKLTASSNNCRITAGKIANNGGYGVNIAASSNSFTNIVGNVFSSNASGAVNDLGTSTVIRGNNGVNDNGIYKGASFNYATGSIQLAAANTERTFSDAAFTKYKEVSISGYGSGVVSVSFDLKHNTGLSTVHGRIYLNGVATGTDQSTTSTAYVTFTQDITVANNDLVQLYVYDVGGVGIGFLRNFILKTANGPEATTTTLD